MQCAAYVKQLLKKIGSLQNTCSTGLFIHLLTYRQVHRTLCVRCSYPHRSQTVGNCGAETSLFYWKKKYIYFLSPTTILQRQTTSPQSQFFTVIYLIQLHNILKCCSYIYIIFYICIQLKTLYKPRCVHNIIYNTGLTLPPIYFNFFQQEYINILSIPGQNLSPLTARTLADDSRSTTMRDQACKVDHTFTNHDELISTQWDTS